VISLRLLAFVNPKPYAKKAIALAAFEAADSSRIEKIKSQFNGRSVRRHYFSHRPRKQQDWLDHAGSTKRQARRLDTRGGDRTRGGH
jgi:hypothetical protein